MLKIEAVSAILAETVGPLFGWPEGEWTQYVKAILPHVQDHTSENLREAARRIALEIDEAYPRRPVPAAFVRHLKMIREDGVKKVFKTQAEIDREAAEAFERERSPEAVRRRTEMEEKLRRLGISIKEEA
jgi:hypothetical protein